MVLGGLQAQNKRNNIIKPVPTQFLKQLKIFKNTNLVGNTDLIRPI